MSYVYLASPYTHPDPKVMRQRYLDAMSCTVWLLRQRIWVYSPVVHCHALAEIHNLPREFEFWQQYNEAMLRHAERLFILASDGWETSKGVRHETNYAYENSIPIRFISTDTCRELPIKFSMKEEQQ